MSGSEENDVLEYLGSLPDREFPDVFVKKLKNVFEHAKEEMIEFLQTKCKDVLSQVRDVCFSEMVKKLTDYDGRELYTRRNIKMLVEDIYVFAFSTLNGLAHAKLSKCLKPMFEQNASLIQDNDINRDGSGLIDICLKLQERIESLERTVKSQNKGITELESQATLNLIEKLKDKSENVGTTVKLQSIKPDTGDSTKTVPIITKTVCASPESVCNDKTTENSHCGGGSNTPKEQLLSSEAKPLAGSDPHLCC